MPVQRPMQRRGSGYRREPAPWWQAEAPFALLAAAALASPFFVLDQGGDWRSAVFAGCVVLGVPGAAIEGMAGVARLALNLRSDPP